MDSNTMIFTNGDVHEDFIVGEHYVGLACKPPTPSFCAVVNCYEDYMVLAHEGDDQGAPKPIWLVKALLSLKFVPTSLDFCWIEVEYSRPSTKYHNVLHTYLGWDTKKGFKWTLNSAYDRANLDKHRYHTLCLEIARGLQIGDNEDPPKTYRFC